MKRGALFLAGLFACGSGSPGLDQASRDYDVEAYALTGHFDWGAQRLVAIEEIALVLDDPGRAVIELDAAVTIERVRHGEEDLSWAFDEEQRKLRVDLSSVVAPIAFSVTYSAPVSGALVAASGRDDDPVTSRVVFTDSEPDRGVFWLVANHHPSDRATWSVQLSVDADEDVIANGTRVLDETDASTGAREVGYRMEQPIPTYLMAFAAGQLEHTDRAGEVPLSVWYRRGLSLDPQAHLDVIGQAMAVFEDLVGPYPWETYSVVLLPQFGGGMENATITFNLETSGQGNVNFHLNAHELAHQWFGDWVTMRDYDDLWVKEGMATLLESEAERALRDVEGRGRRFGWDFSFNPQDAVVDRSLQGLSKYTTGPYQRAAWMITQIRVAVGEEAFWGSLRAMLASHALGSIDGEGFVRSFAPALTEAQIQRILAALERKPPPGVYIALAPGGAGTQVTLTLRDPSQALLAPVEVTTVDAAGAATLQTLAVGTPLVVTIPVGGYLAPDEADVHPDWGFSFDVDTSVYFAELAQLFVPSSPQALAAFGTHSSAHQERALNDWGLPPVEPAPGFTDLFGELDSTTARRLAERSGCETLGYLADTGGSAAAWEPVLAPVLQAATPRSFSTRYARCGIALATDAFGGEVATLVEGADPIDAGRLLYLMSFDYGPAQSLSTLGQAATGAPSLQLREQAIARLSFQAQTGNGYTPVPAEEAQPWKEFFRARLAATTSQTRFRNVWRGVVGLGDEEALATAGTMLQHVPMSGAFQRQVVCEARAIAGDAAWTAFQEAAQPWSNLAPEAAAALANPALCQAGKPALLRKQELPLLHVPGGDPAGAADRHDRPIG